MTTISSAIKPTTSALIKNSTAEKELDKKIEIRKKQIERLEARRQKVRANQPFWTDSLRTLAELLLPRLPNHHFDIMGPFGLDHETSIHFIDKGVEDPYRNGGVSSLTFSCNFEYDDVTHEVVGFKLMFKDNSSDSGEFKKGTVGAINGLNHLKIDCSDWTLDEIFSKITS